MRRTVLKHLLETFLDQCRSLLESGQLARVLQEETQLVSLCGKGLGMSVGSPATTAQRRRTDMVLEPVEQLDDHCTDVDHLVFECRRHRDQAGFQCSRESSAESV